jgi:hypothetical protein
MTKLQKGLVLLSLMTTQWMGWNAYADEAKAKPKAMDFNNLAKLPGCETAVSDSVDVEQAIDADGKQFINTMGADGQRRVGVPSRMGVVEEAKKNEPYFNQYYVPYEEKAREFVNAVVATAKTPDTETHNKLEKILAAQPAFQVTVHMDTILKSEFLTRAITDPEEKQKAGALVGQTVQELIDRLMEMDPKVQGKARMRVRNFGRRILQKGPVKKAAQLVRMDKVLKRRVDSMVTGKDAIAALNNRLDLHIGQLKRNLVLFDKEDSAYREQAEQCRHALAYQILADHYLRESLKTETSETDAARALLIEEIMLPSRREIMSLRARLIQLDAVLSERVHQRKNYRRIMKEAEELRAVGILVIAGTVSNHHASQDAQEASNALNNARAVLNQMMQTHADDFAKSMQAGREGQRQAILTYETALKVLTTMKDEMTKEALHAADTVNQLPEVARLIELTGMELGELRDKMQKGADIAALIEERNLKVEGGDKKDQANAIARIGWNFFRQTGGAGSTTPTDDGQPLQRPKE